MVSVSDWITSRRRSKRNESRTSTRGSTRHEAISRRFEEKEEDPQERNPRRKEEMRSRWCSRRPTRKGLAPESRNKARLRIRCESLPSVSTDHVEEKKKQYNEALQAYSKAPFEYRFDLGLYYHRVAATCEGSLLVGSQPTSANDIDYLKLEENVSVIFNTQQDRDMEYWGVDFEKIKERIHENKMNLVRIPFPDFDPEGLRVGLPRAVAKLNMLLEQGETVYLHCTAGMGRSPAVAIAWFYWYGPFETLDEAYNYLTEIRPCGPNKDAIRFATCDILNAIGSQEGFSVDDTLQKVESSKTCDVPELMPEEKEAIKKFLCDHIAAKAAREEPSLLEKFRCFCEVVVHQVSGE